MKSRVLRSIVGWAPLVDNDWHELMQKMSRKLKNAQQIFHVRSWIERLLVGRFRFAAKIASGINFWASITSEWYPYQRWQMNCCVEPRRRIGRPVKRWDDQMQSFAQEIFHSSWFQAAKYETWSSHYPGKRPQTVFKKHAKHALCVSTLCEHSMCEHCV